MYKKWVIDPKIGKIQNFIPKYQMIKNTQKCWEKQSFCFVLPKYPKKMGKIKFKFCKQSVSNRLWCKYPKWIKLKCQFCKKCELFFKLILGWNYINLLKIKYLLLQNYKFLKIGRITAQNG